ncbi:hypothetical protein [Fictibacillus fluitans]|uniref:Group-specific protein n=1 Tax=Fictibacillus fluitans TaxID=3058422 RepID=A0ABT8HT73_9BACL|nr:hypothetical protein [Fictibacillus sp. NE201]MDN4523977.1 hypothetical protein [Fictibacillus sp. NE201]
MHNRPEYAEMIIVLVRYKSLYQWYVTDKEIWYLDLKKLISSYRQKGFEVHNPDDFSDRFDIAVVNENTAEEFLQRISGFQVSHEELRKMLVQKTYHDVLDMQPSLYVNFDEKELISSFPEPASYEHYVPYGWLGKYEQFTEEVPINNRYWIINGENLFFMQ